MYHTLVLAMGGLPLSGEWRQNEGRKTEWKGEGVEIRKRNGRRGSSGLDIKKIKITINTKINYCF